MQEIQSSMTPDLMNIRDSCAFTSRSTFADSDLDRGWGLGRLLLPKHHGETASKQHAGATNTILGLGKTTSTDTESDRVEQTSNLPQLVANISPTKLVPDTHYNGELTHPSGIYYWHGLEWPYTNRWTQYILAVTSRWLPFAFQPNCATRTLAPGFGFQPRRCCTTCFEWSGDTHWYTWSILFTANADDEGLHGTAPTEQTVIDTGDWTSCPMLHHPSMPCLEKWQWVHLALRCYGNSRLYQHPGQGQDDLWTSSWYLCYSTTWCRRSRFTAYRRTTRSRQCAVHGGSRWDFQSCGRLHGCHQTTQAYANHGLFSHLCGRSRRRRSGCSGPTQVAWHGWARTDNQRGGCILLQIFPTQKGMGAIPGDPRRDIQCDASHASCDRPIEAVRRSRLSSDGACTPHIRIRNPLKMQTPSWMQGGQGPLLCDHAQRWKSVWVDQDWSATRGLHQSRPDWQG